MSTGKFTKLIIVFLVITVSSMILPVLLPEISFHAYKADVFASSDTKSYPISDKNSKRIIIPAINLNAEILRADSVDILNEQEGVWLDTYIEKADSTSHLVLAGHRFQYLPPNQATFYHLDKLKVGDRLELYWDGQVSIYEYISTREVVPTDVSIRDSAEDEGSVIYLYTCTPIFTAENRLVVKFKKIY